MPCTMIMKIKLTKIDLVNWLYQSVRPVEKNFSSGNFSQIKYINLNSFPFIYTVVLLISVLKFFVIFLF